MANTAKLIGFNYMAPEKVSRTINITKNERLSSRMTGIKALIIMCETKLYK